MSRKSRQILKFSLGKCYKNIKFSLMSVEAYGKIKTLFASEREEIALAADEGIDCPCDKSLGNEDMYETCEA